MAKNAKTFNETASTGIGLLLWPFFAKPRENKGDNGQVKLEYECVMVFEKLEDYADISRLAERAGEAVWGPDRNKWPKGWASPLKKCNDKAIAGDNGDVFPPGMKADAMYIKAKSSFQPCVVDHNVKTIIDITKDVYSGCKGILSVNAYVYGGPGTPFKPGISFGLRGFQKIEDGEPLGGRVDPSKEFKAYKKPGDTGDKAASDLL